MNRDFFTAPLNCFSDEDVELLKIIGQLNFGIPSLVRVTILTYEISMFYCILHLVGYGNVGVLVIKSAVVTKAQRCKPRGVLKAVIS